MLSQATLKNCYQGFCWLLSLSQKFSVANISTTPLAPCNNQSFSFAVPSYVGGIRGMGGRQKRNFIHGKGLRSELSLRWPNCEAGYGSVQNLYLAKGYRNTKSSLRWLTLLSKEIHHTLGDKVATTAGRTQNFITSALGNGHKYKNQHSNRSNFNSLLFAYVWRMFHQTQAKQTIDSTRLR